MGTYQGKLCALPANLISLTSIEHREKREKDYRAAVVRTYVRLTKTKTTRGITGK